MKIIYKKTDEIKPYKNNPRRNDDAVDPVANSIREFGFKVPIVIDKNNEIVAGHTRYKAAQLLDMQEVPCIIADDLNEEQVKAFRLADNKTAELAGWDFEILDCEIGELQRGINMEDFGFQISEDVDLDDFFEDAKETEKEKKLITCPHCGKPIEV